MVLILGTLETFSIMIRESYREVLDLRKMLKTLILAIDVDCRTGFRGHLHLMGFNF